MSIRAAIAILGVSAAPVMADTLRIDWLERRTEPPPILANMAPPPDTLGWDGVRLGITDVATTGKFLNQTYELRETTVAPDQDFLPAAQALLAGGARVLIVRAPAADLLALADLPEARDALILNTSAADDALRGAECRTNILHTLPSRAMLTDALAQFLVFKRWTKLALIEGTLDGDAAYAAALKASLAKFGLTLAGEKTWAFDNDMRRNATAEVPLFTQDLPDHDVLLVADEPGDFARYVAYNTWYARPLAGTEGLVPAGWAPVVENWGASQLQSRFMKQSGRMMQPADFAGWVAVAALGEAMTRQKTTAPADLRAYLLSPDFRLAAFLGEPVSFRAWDGQMRQPIPLVTERAMVGLAPLEGFLHQNNELDTLGADRPDSACTAFGG